MWYDIYIVFFITITIHEYGHYLYAKWKDCNPKIRIHPLYISVDGFYDKLTFVEKFNLHAAGILLGLIPVIIYNDVFFYFIYFLMCSADLLVMVVLLLYLRRFGNRKVVDGISLVSY